MLVDVRDLKMVTELWVRLAVVPTTVRCLGELLGGAVDIDSDDALFEEDLDTLTATMIVLLSTPILAPYADALLFGWTAYNQCRAPLHDCLAPQASTPSTQLWSEFVSPAPPQL